MKPDRVRCPACGAIGGQLRHQKPTGGSEPYVWKGVRWYRCIRHGPFKVH
jgi:hypothetical protein